MKKITSLLIIICILLSVFYINISASALTSFSSFTNLNEGVTETPENTTDPGAETSYTDETTEQEIATTGKDNNTEPSETVNEQKEFLAPNIVKITDTNNGVKIIWDTQRDVYKYKLFIKNGNAWSALCTTYSNSYIHKAKIGTTYTYTVRIIDENNNYVSPYNKTGWKHTAYLETPIILTPDYDAKSAIIQWKKVTNAVRYRLFIKKDSDKSWKTVGDTVSTSYKVDNLSDNNKYIFTVRCVSKDGSQWQSDYDHSGYVLTYHTAPKLTNIQGAATGVRIEWKASKGVRYYKVYYKDNDSAWKAASVSPVTGTSYVFKTSSYNHKITLTVKCADAQNRSTSFHEYPGLSIVYLTTPHITSVTEDVSDMMLKWSSVKGVYKYKVFFHNGNTWKTIGTTSGTSFTYSDGYCDFYNDKTGGTYRFTVRCIDKYGKYVSSFDSPGFAHDYKFIPKVLKKQIKVPYYSQTVMRAGCETYATTMLLHFYGFKISPVDFADEFVIQRPASFVNGVMYGPSMDSAMCGNVYNGWGINAKGMAKCINNYLVDRKSKLRATAITGKSLQYLCNKYVANGTPVLVWSTSQLTEAYVASRWIVNYTNGDDHKTNEEWYHGEHCLVLIGFDFPNRRYIYNDSLALDRSIGVSNWAKVRSEDRFETLGSQSIVIK